MFLVSLNRKHKEIFATYLHGDISIDVFFPALKLNSWLSVPPRRRPMREEKPSLPLALLFPFALRVASFSRLLQRRTLQPTTQARSQLSLCQGEIFFDHCPRDDAQNRDGGQYKVPARAVRGVAGKVSVLRQQGEEREAEKSRGDQAQGKET